MLPKSEIHILVGYMWLRLWGPPLAVVARLTDWRVNMTAEVSPLPVWMETD
jgi:hypothetical protein